MKYSFYSNKKIAVPAKIWLFVLVFFASWFSSCKKTEDILIANNTPPNYKSVPTIKVENYVNRAFIDLMGREPTNVERLKYVDYLKLRELSMAARDTMLRELVFDNSYHPGDSSYNHACFQRIYDLSKARFLEGAGDDDIGQQIGILEFSITISRLNGDSVGVYAAKDAQRKYRDILESRWKYRLGLISYAEMCAAMMNNPIYDQINMNSFNFVNASFDDLFQRQPVKDEFNAAYDIIDKNIPRQIFGQWASNKNEYLSVLTTSAEFYEAQIRWMYYILLQREATTQEVINLFGNYARSKNLQEVQIQIIKTDEYAQFRR